MNADNRNSHRTLDRHHSPIRPIKPTNPSEKGYTMTDPKNPTLSVEFYHKLIDGLDGTSWEIWARFMDDRKVIHDVFAPYGDPSNTVINWMDNRVCDWVKR